MKKILGALIGILLVFAIGGPVMAGAGFQGIQFNPEVRNHSPSEFDGNDWAIRVLWYHHPHTVIKAEEFEFQRIQGEWETELTQVEARIKERIDDILVKRDLLNSFDEDDECRQDPPILGPNEEIVIIKNREWLFQYRKRFAIHITSQDPLIWDTMVSKHPIPPNWWE